VKVQRQGQSHPWWLAISVELLLWHSLLSSVGSGVLLFVLYQEVVVEEEAARKLAAEQEAVRKRAADEEAAREAARARAVEVEEEAVRKRAAVEVEEEAVRKRAAVEVEEEAVRKRAAEEEAAKRAAEGMRVRLGFFVPPYPTPSAWVFMLPHPHMHPSLLGAQVAPLALPRGVALDKLRPLPALKTDCGPGAGMAACPALGVLVTSSMHNTLSVFALSRSSGVRVGGAAGAGGGAGAGAGAGAGLALVCTLGGTSSPPPMQFKFSPHGGWLAFTGPATSRLLLLTDAGHDAVHVIDVAGRVHVGYVAAPGTIAGPQGVAARGSLVAVSACQKYDSSDHVVRLFEGSGASWSEVRVVAGGLGGRGSAHGQLCYPQGLRFTGDGKGLVVADSGNFRVSVFRVEDGSFVRHVATGLKTPLDVEECEGGWLVACSASHTIEFVGGGGVGRARLGKFGSGDGEFSSPSALTLVPDLGLVVRDRGNGGRFQVFG
jgi:hypothetical protein